MKKVPKQPAVELVDLDAIYATRETLTLRDYQARHLPFLMAQRRALDLSDAGTGKTPVACLWIYALVSDGGKVIWTMQKSLMVKNYEELLLWSNLEPQEIVIVDGTPTQRLAQMSYPEAKVFIMGYSSFADNWPIVREYHPETVHLAVDELHLGFSTHGEPDFRRQGKYYGTARTAKMYQFMQKGGAFLGMTGTLINGRLDSAFPSLKVIEPRYYPTLNNFYEWHAILDTYGKPCVWKNHERLNTLVDRHSCQITYEAAYGKENKHILIETCTMSPRQRKAYEEMAKRGIAALNSEEYLESSNEAVALRRAFEIMQIPEKYGLPINKLDGKEAHLRTHFENAKETGKPLLVFEKIVEAHGKWTALARSVGLNAEFMNGRVTGLERNRIDVEFRRGNIDVLICSPEVAGVGFNWGHVDDLIFSLPDYQDGTFIQNYRRAMRGVREKALRIFVLQYRNSLDQKLAKKLEGKSENRLQIHGGSSVDLTNKVTHV